VALETRWFHVDPNTFRQGLQGVTGAPFGNGSAAGNGTGQADAVTVPQTSVNAGAISLAGLQPLLRQFLSSAGMNMDTNNEGNMGKQFIYNDRKGILVVRATSNELENIGTALDVLNEIPAEVNIKTRFVEMDQPPDRRLLSSLLQTGTNQPLGAVTGILTAKQFRAALDALERRNDVDELNAPEITTLLGRQVQVSVNDNSPKTNLLNLPQVVDKNLREAGPILDVIPSVGSDEWNVNLKLTVNAPTWSTNSTSPSERQRNQVTSSIMVHDGQTVMLAGMPIANSKPGSNKCLIVFVTPTLINPDGSRFHPKGE
jgi:type II secretory pathway component GspD/PulD (secretin)